MRTRLKVIFLRVYKYRDAALRGFLALGIFLIAIYRLSETGQPILFNDEIGYWSNCNFLLGKSWIPVTNRIGYYSYGYSLLLIPVRLLGMHFGWRWNELYHAGVILNALLLVVSFFLAQKIAERFMPDLHRYVRLAACFVIFVYPSTVVYAHITWSECTLLALVWVFLYLMMRIIDKPGAGNHIAFAAVAFYMYTVHQRALGVLAASVLVVVYLRLLKRNTLHQAFAYAMTLYGGYLLHSMLKKHIQNVNYLGQEAGGFRQILGYGVNKRSLLLLSGLLAGYLFFYYYGKNRKRALQALAVAVWLVWIIRISASGGGVYAVGEPAADAVRTGIRDRLMMLLEGSFDQNRISTNDFTGQIFKLRNIFTKNGLIRLGVSITGKWFYMASGSALMVCWGILALLSNVWILIWKHLKQPFVMIKKKCSAPEYFASAMAEDAWKNRIWFLGVFLTWFSTFMISAIYKEGLYKNDDLLNGRYIDFVFGVLLVYGFYCLLKDRYWILSGAVFAGLYLAAGWLCDDILGKLQRTTFELAHCVLFGRVIWNYTPPLGRIGIIVKYVLCLSAAFILLVKLGSRAAGDAACTAARGKRLCAPAGAACMLAAFLIPLCAWGYIGKEVVDKYVVVRNEKQEEPFVQMTEWIDMLGNGDTPVYYVLDYANGRYVGAVQFMLPDDTVIPIWAGECSFEEEAFYIVRSNVLEDPAIQEKCKVIYKSGGYRLAVVKRGELAEKYAEIHFW